MAARLFQSLLILLVMAFVIYGLIGLMPGDPITLMINSNPHMTAADAARLRALYGLDQPLLGRFWHWLLAALQGELGYSRLFSQPVGTVIMARLPYSLLLMGCSLILALLLALPLAVVAAYQPNSKLDALINLACFTGVSLPAFWLAILLILLFSVTLGWLPANSSDVEQAPELLSKLRAMIMPVLTLTVASCGTYTRYLRAALLEVAQQDFMRTARAKGLSAFGALWRHGLRHALLPLVTLVGIELGNLFSGALITETMFGWPGMGRLIYDAIMGNDYNLALAALLLATAMTLVGNLLADLVYRRIDPRLRRHQS